MWIKDNWGRLVNSDNILHIQIKDENKGKKTQPSWVLEAKMVKSDWNQCYLIHLTEGHRDKSEAKIRMDAIIDAIKKEWIFLELE